MSVLLSHPLTPAAAQAGVRPRDRAGHRRGRRRHLGKRVPPPLPRRVSASQARGRRRDESRAEARQRPGDPGGAGAEGPRPDGGSPRARLPAARPRTARRSDAPQLQPRRLLAASHAGRRGVGAPCRPCRAASPPLLSVGPPPPSSPRSSSDDFFLLLPPSPPLAAQLLPEPKHKHSGPAKKPLPPAPPRSRTQQVRRVVTSAVAPYQRPREGLLRGGAGAT